MSPEEIIKRLRENDTIKFYHLNKGSLPTQLVEMLEKNYDSFYFMFNVFVPFMDDLNGPVKELMLRHYPAFKKEKRPGMIARMDEICKVIGVDLIRGIGALMNLKKKGKTIREDLDPFEQWVEDNTPWEETFEEVRENERIEFGMPDDERWEEVKKRENAFRHDEIEWVKKRRFEFIDLLQNTLLKYFKGIELFTADDFTYYSLLLRAEYEYFWEVCERIEHFLDWGLPEEDFDLSYAERSRKQVAMGNEKRWAVAKLRYRRVYGEQI